MSDNREYEGEPFEDAAESVSQSIPSPAPHGNSTRSLTDPSPTIGSPGHPPSLPSQSLDEKPEDDVPDDGPGDTVPNHDASGDAPDNSTHSAEQPKRSESPQSEKPEKSPLLTARRLSTSSLDEVNLVSSKEDEENTNNSGRAPERPPIPPPLPSRESTSTQNSHMKGLSGTLPAVPWDPPPPVRKNTPPAAPAPPPLPARKFTSPFSWLTRGTSASKETKPSQNGRRDTATSASTASSNQEHLGRLPETEEPGKANGVSTKPHRSSLKDQFKLLRMREEGAIPEHDEAGDESGRRASSQSTKSSPDVSGEGEDRRTSASHASTTASTINPNLPPGTVSGISTSATDASAPVNWELWQQLVNHGPEALKGANSDELNAAIKRGIPQTIRGVIWQILADSRDPELEEVYRGLVARGTDKDKDSFRDGSGHLSNGTTSEKDKESTQSSRSSSRSASSTTAANVNGASSTTSHEQDPEKLAKEQATSEATRHKKAQEDAAALQRLEKSIKRDLGGRTSYSRYFVSQGSQDALFGLCKAYALYDEGVGYAQGMNFIAMPLLFNMDEAEAFTLLVKLMNNYGLRDMFIHDMPGLHRSLYLFERLLEDLEPALYCHLRRREVPPQLYATQWFLTLFAYRFPLQLVLRIYDLVFEEGLESTILRFAVATMRRNADTLLSMKDMSPLTAFLKERLFDVYIDRQPSPTSILESGFFGSSGAADKEVYRADIMVDDACAVPLTDELIQIYSAEWEETSRAEKERETEIETLRNTNSSQASRIRVLEEHTETSDKEHVQLASELVRLKVENEELEDLNDALKIQVQELKNVVDKQPADVEEKFRAQVDHAIQRNIEVQDENKGLVDQMAEMEKELVNAKMKWAEVNDQHETLKQKWSDLRRALD